MPEMTRQEAKDLIHGAGLRATAPRVAVLRILTASPKPLSHSEVITALGSDEWDQATLYRNLLKLVEVDLARVASQMGGITRYEARADDDPHVHPHFSCQTCGRVECLPEAKLGGSVEVRWHRSLEGSQLQLIGQCPDCLDTLSEQTSAAGPKVPVAGTAKARAGRRPRPGAESGNRDRKDAAQQRGSQGSKQSGSHGHLSERGVPPKDPRCSTKSSMGPGVA